MDGVRDAATVVLLRESPALEVLLLRRHARSGFMAGAYVFPGGKVDPADHGAADEALLTHARALEPTPGRPLDDATRVACLRAACRETREEAGVELDPRSLLYWAHWITPSLEPKRFDTRFFMALLPAGQTARHDEREITDLRWLRPSDALAQHEAGDMFLPPPTQRTIEELALLSDFAAVRAAHRARVIAPILPKLISGGDGFVILLPWDPRYAAEPGEGLMVPDRTVWGASSITIRPPSSS